jgi:hypothetical protein
LAHAPIELGWTDEYHQSLALMTNRPFVPFMVADFFGTEEGTGVYVGILASAFHIAQVIIYLITAAAAQHHFPHLYFYLPAQSQINQIVFIISHVGFING